MMQTTPRRLSGKEWHDQATLTLMQDWLAHQRTDLSNPAAVRLTLAAGGFKPGYVALYERSAAGPARLPQ